MCHGPEENGGMAMEIGPVQQGENGKVQWSVD